MVTSENMTEHFIRNLPFRVNRKRMKTLSGDFFGFLDVTVSASTATGKRRVERPLYFERRHDELFGRILTLGSPSENFSFAWTLNGKWKQHLKARSDYSDSDATSLSQLIGILFYFYYNALGTGHSRITVGWTNLKEVLIEIESVRW